MEKRLKRFSLFSSFILGAVLALGVGAGIGNSKGATEVSAANVNGSASITFADLNLKNQQQYTDPFTIDNTQGDVATITFAGGENDGKYYTTGSGIRTYGGGTITIAATTGNLTSAVFTWDGSYKPTANVADVGSYSTTNNSWTGTAESVVLTRPSGSGHWRLKSVTVTTVAASSEYHVTYYGNGNTSGNVPTDGNTYTSSSNTVKVLGNEGNLVKANASPSFNYTFGGWNTMANGTGTTYQPGATFTISKDTDLYAVWTDPRTEVTLSIDDMDIYLGESDVDISSELTSSPSGHTSGYSLTSASTDYVTIVDNKLHAVAKGSSVITVHIENDGSFKYTDKTFTVNVKKNMDDNGTGTINFGSDTDSLNIKSSSVSGEDSQSNSWTVTTVGTSSFTPNPSYAQIGSSGSPATSITFTTTLAKSVRINSLSAKFGGFSGTAGTITLKVGDTTVGTGSLNATSDVTVNNSSVSTGNVLTVTVTGISKGVKAYYVSYTYVTPVSVTSVSLSPSSVTLAPTATQQLTATVLPANASDKTVSFESNKPNVATVTPEGLVTAIADGTATITVTTTDGGKTATCDVTVETPTEAWVMIQSTAVGIENGDVVEIDITYGGSFVGELGVAASNSNVEVSLDDKNNGTGTVTISFKHAGSSVISFKDGDDAIKTANSTCNVTILEKLNAIQAETFTSSTVSFGDKDWAADGWTKTKSGNGYNASQGIQVTTGTTGAGASSDSSFNNVSKVVVTYNTNKSAGAGSITIKIGSNDAKTNSVGYSSGDGTSSNYTTEFDYGTKQSGSIAITVNTTTNSIWFKSITIYTSNGTKNIANTNVAVQQEVLNFVTTMNTDLSVCSSSSNLSTDVWSDLAADFEDAANESSNEELFRNMFKYADATPRAQDGTATTGDSLQNALARYNYILEKYGVDDYEDFMGRAEANKVEPKQNSANLFGLVGKQNSSTVLILIVSLSSVATVGATMLLRKRKED